MLLPQCLYFTCARLKQTQQQTFAIVTFMNQCEEVKRASQWVYTLYLRFLRLCFWMKEMSKERGCQKQIALPNKGGLVQSVQAQIEEVKTTIQEGKILPSALV